MLGSELIVEVFTSNVASIVVIVSCALLCSELSFKMFVTIGVLVSSTFSSTLHALVFSSTLFDVIAGSLFSVFIFSALIGSESTSGMFTFVAVASVFFSASFMGPKLLFEISITAASVVFWVSVLSSLVGSRLSFEMHIIVAGFEISVVGTGAVFLVYAFSTLLGSELSFKAFVIAVGVSFSVFLSHISVFSEFTFELFVTTASVSASVFVFGIWSVVSHSTSSFASVMHCKCGKPSSIWKDDLLEEGSYIEELQEDTVDIDDLLERESP